MLSILKNVSPGIVVGIVGSLVDTLLAIKGTIKKVNKETLKVRQVSWHIQNFLHHGRNRLNDPKAQVVHNTDQLK